MGLGHFAQVFFGEEFTANGQKLFLCHRSEWVDGTRFGSTQLLTVHHLASRGSTAVFGRSACSCTETREFTFPTGEGAKKAAAGGLSGGPISG